MTVIGTHRPTRVLVDEAAIKHNVSGEVARLDDQTELFAVIKADAYGHGLLRVARVALAAGARGFCVAILDEALALREASFEQPILVLGVVSPEYVQLAAINHVAVPLVDAEWLESARPYLAADHPLAVHVALDTGMGRIGFRNLDDLREVLDTITGLDGMQIEGVFTHFATADDPDTSYFQEQVAKFKQLVAAFPERPRYVHVSNTATSLWHAACNGNMIRFGVGIYGLNPSGRAIEQTPYELQPAMSVVSALVQCKQIHAGDAVSYGATYRASGDEWIGTVPIGYADGYPRRMQGFHGLVDGQECTIVGRVCMDQLMIRMPRAYPAGTKVTLVGQDGNNVISLQDVADYAGTIHYEIACAMSERIPRESINPVGA